MLPVSLCILSCTNILLMAISSLISVFRVCWSRGLEQTIFHFGKSCQFQNICWHFEMINHRHFSVGHQLEIDMLASDSSQGAFLNSVKFETGGLLVVFTGGLSVDFKIPLWSKCIRIFGFCRSVSKIHLHSFSARS